MGDTGLETVGGGWRGAWCSEVSWDLFGMEPRMEPWGVTSVSACHLCSHQIRQVRVAAYNTLHADGGENWSSLDA